MFRDLRENPQNTSLVCNLLHPLCNPVLSGTV